MIQVTQTGNGHISHTFQAGNGNVATVIQND